jgi:hypothetical protein
MADAAITTTTSASAAMQQAASMTFDAFGMQINLTGVAIALVIFGILFLFYRIQKTDKLDFADMITKDGKAVSLTKVLQLIGGVSATWVIIKLTLTGGLTEAIFGLYLTYVGAIEGYSKFVAAKYGYKESSIKDAKDAPDEDAADPSLKPPKV